MEVFTFADSSAAGRADETRFKDYPTTIASSEADLADKPGPTLVNLYNGLIDEGAPPVNKFTTRGDGARRVFALLVEKYAGQAVEAESENVAPGDAKPAGDESNEDSMATKGKKAKKAAKAKKAPRIKSERVPKEKRVRAPRPKKDRQYKAEVISKGSEKRKADALALIERKTGATAAEIKDKLGVTLGTAKNLVWYLRRDGHKIVVDRESERKPYVIK